MSKTVASLPGGNFGLIAVDDFNQIAYGYLQTTSGGGIWGVHLGDGSDFPVSRMTASESGVIWASLSGVDLVWAQGESHDVIGDWTIQLWDGKSGKQTELASSKLPDGTYLENELVFPVVANGYVAWNQPTSGSSADLEVYSLATGAYRTLDSGVLSSPVFAGHYLVWAKVGDSQTTASLHFADADTLQSVRGPAELSRPYRINYLAGSDQFLLWIANASTASQYRLTVDQLAAGRLKTYVSDDSHFLQFPMIAGYYMVWYGPAGNSVADLRTGAAIDVSANGTAAAAGDTIVVAKLAPAPTKGAITSTTISVLHPSALSSLPACAV